jgi:hypothetical protein
MTDAPKQEAAMIRRGTSPSQSRSPSASPTRYPCVLQGLVEACAAEGVRLPQGIQLQLAPASIHIETLNLRRRLIPTALAAVLARHLPQLVSLRTLSLLESEISHDAIGLFADALSRMYLSHPDITFELTGTAPGPRVLAHLRRLKSRHPGVTITGIADVTVTADPFLPVVESPLTVAAKFLASPPSGRSRAEFRDEEDDEGDSPYGGVSRAATVAYLEEKRGRVRPAISEEALLESLLQSQMNRLCKPVAALHREQNAAAAAEFCAAEAEARQALTAGWRGGMSSLEAARAFEMPFKAPYFDPDGLLCAPLRLRDSSSAPDPVERELAALKARLFVSEDALKRHVESAAGGVTYGVDGRPLRRHRLLPDETLEHASIRFNLPFHELKQANDLIGLPNEAEQAVVIPMSLEALLIEQLTSERAAAVRLQTFTEPDRAVSDAEYGAQLATLHRELQHRAAERDETQRRLREIEIQMYQKRRDSWLRFLRRQEALLSDHSRISAELLLEHDEQLAHDKAAEGHHAAAVQRVLDAARLTPEELELQALKLRAIQLESRCRTLRPSASPTRNERPTYV